MGKNQKKRFFLMPVTSSGKLSVELILVFVLTFCIFQIHVISGQRGGETFFDNLLLALPVPSMAFAGILSFAFGIFGIVLKKERSFSVFVSTTVGFLILMFIMGEDLCPH